MAGSAGPQGTGLLPPVAETPEATPPPDPATIEGAPPADGGAGTQAPLAPSTDDIDAVPPVDGGDDDDDGSGAGTTDGGAPDLNALTAEIEARLQKRFDKAVSKGIRNALQKVGVQQDSNDDDNAGTGGDDGGGQAPPARRNQSSVPDVRSIRLLVRDQISDSMEAAGAVERKTAKSLLDRIVPVIDWTQVDDEQEFIEELVEGFKTAANDLIKVGSDRKVAQLRSLGHLPQKDGQAGTAPAGTAAPAPS